MKAHDKQVADTNAALTAQMAVTSAAIQQRDANAQALQAWYHNGFFMSAAGFLVGVLAAGYAIKR